MNFLLAVFRRTAMCCLLCLIILATSVSTAQAQPITVKINDMTLASDSAPLVINGRLLLPMRSIFEAIGATIDYFPDTRIIEASKGATFIKLSVDSKIVTVNGEIIVLDVAPFIHQARVYIPARFASETLGATVGFDQGKRIVNISTCSIGRDSINKVDQVARIKSNDFGRAELSPIPQLFIYNNNCDWKATGETFLFTLAAEHTWNIPAVKDIKILPGPNPQQVTVGKADNASMTISYPKPNVMKLYVEKYSPWIDDSLMVPMNVVLKNPDGAIKVVVSREGTGQSETFTIADALKPPQGILISKQKAQIELLEYLNLNANVFPYDAYDTGVIWSSSDLRIASVDQTGLVRGLALGTAVINVRTKQGSFSDYCMIEVIPEYYSIIYDYADHVNRIKTMVVPIPAQNARHAGITADIRLLSPGKWNIDRYRDELMYNQASTDYPFIAKSQDTLMDIEFPDEQTLRITMRSAQGWSSGDSLSIPLNIRLENPSGEIIVSVSQVSGAFENQTYRFAQ